MAISQIIKTKRDGTLVITDNGASHSLTVQFEDGNLVINIPGPTILLFLDRGRITAPPSIRYGDDQPMSGSFSGYLRDLSDAGYATLESILMQAGYILSTWVGTMGATGEVKTYSLAWTIEGSDHGDGADHTCTLPYCAFSGSVKEGAPGSVDMSFTSYALYPTVT